MRKIEKQVLAALNGRKGMKGRNTTVEHDHMTDTSCIRLHGHRIATYHHKTMEVEVDEYTLARWPTVTTKSRLRALGVNVYTEDFVTYLDGFPV